MARRTAVLTLLLGALARCGDGSSGGAHALDDARRALAAGELRRADTRAKQAAEAQREDIAVLGLFLRGNIAFAECVRAEQQADGPGAEPFALDVAIRHAERARDRWQDAAATRADWPAARRNVERALVKLAQLEEKKAQRKPDRKKTDPQPKPRPQPKAPPPTRTRKESKKSEPVPLLQELPAAEVDKLLLRLAQKEAEKLALRRAERKKRNAPTERDW